MKIGFFGGSFDPVHFGHLCAAQDAYEQLQLDRLIFVPAAQAPLKPQEVQASPMDRLAMLRLAIAAHPQYEVSDYEICRGGVSYTIDTVRHFRQRFPQDQLFWIIGADQLSKLAKWKQIDALVPLIDFVYLERPGHPLTALPAVAGLRVHRCLGHLLEISSTELRDRCRRGLPLDCFMPHKAIVYLQENALYRAR